MSMLTASAPGKVILFGEHAVVYGRPAIVCAISRRVRVTAELAGDGVVVEQRGVRQRLRLGGEGKPRGRFRYVAAAVEEAFREAGRRSGVRLSIRSELPEAAGLGSSAAVSVATLLAVLRLLGAEVSPGRLAELGHRVELRVQGAASPTDTAISAHGGMLYIHGGGYERLTPPELRLVVGDTRVKRRTADLVARVSTLYRRHERVVESLLDAIGAVTLAARGEVERHSVRRLGELMNINHHLLEALGVSTPELNRLVHAARAAGAEGAKLTGAGGGGCMVALAQERHGEVLEALSSSCSAFSVEVSAEGAVIEG